MNALSPPPRAQSTKKQVLGPNNVVRPSDKSLLVFVDNSTDQAKWTAFEIDAKGNDSAV